MAPRTREASEAVRAASRARLLAAARSTFADEGFDDARVAAIARRAAMSPGNVYWHFASKEAMLRAILADGFAARGAMLGEVADEYGPARRKLEILVDRSLAFLDRSAEFAAIAVRLAGGGGRERLRSLGFDPDGIARRDRDLVRRVLAEARSEGAVAPADPDTLAVLLLAFLDGVAAAGPERPPALAREPLRDAVLRLLGYRPAG